MPSYVAFLRAVNVGGRSMRMAALRAALAGAGFQGVETHIQTGNVLLRSPQRSTERVADRLESVLGEWAGFEVPCVVRTPATVSALVGAVDATPALCTPGGARYVALTRHPVSADAAQRLAQYRDSAERGVVVEGDILLEMPESFAGARLAGPRLERLVGTAVTARDLRVLRTIEQKWGA